MPLRALDLSLRLAIFLTIGWALYSSLQVGTTVLPAELKPLEKTLQANDITQARQRIDGYLQKHPGSIETYKLVIMLCARYSRADLMIDYARRGLQDCADASTADRAELYRMRSNGYLMSGKAQANRAQVDARQALALDKDNPESLNNYAYVMAETSVDPNELKEAEADSSRSLKLLGAQSGLADPAQSYAMYQDTYGWILYKEGLYGPMSDRAEAFKRAVDALVQATDNLSDQTLPDVVKPVYYHLGAAYRRAGKPAEARQALQISLKYDPRFPEALAEMKALDAEATAKPTPASIHPALPPKPPGRAARAAFTPLSQSFPAPTSSRF